MPIVRPIQKICPSCNKSFTRMQGDVITPSDLNPLCKPCSMKALRKKLGKLGKLLKGPRFF